MDQSFFAIAPGTTYPLQLPPGASASAEISPAQTASGELAGTMTWRDDVPSTYEVALALEYISDGTALSPRALDFGVVAVDELSAAQRINLENCGADSGPVKIKSLRGLRGPIGSWKILPRVGFSKQLAMHEKQAIEIAFQGTGRGRYEAELVVETKSGLETIRLIAEATGRDFANTSFYTCGCGTPGAPWRGWPVALAIVIVSVRRRRGSSSPR
jgi:hypothetical protein